MAVFGLKKIYLNQVANNYENYDQVTVSSYGYYMGGLVLSGPFNVSDVDRLDFSTDTVSFPHYHPQVLGSNVSAFHDSTNNYGYFIGAVARGSAGTVCAIDRMDFVNETWLQTYLVAGSNGGANTFNSQYGYIQQAPTPLTNYDCDVIRISFSDSTGQTLTDIFPQHTTGSRTLSSQSFGYFVGGNSPAVPTPPPSNATSNVFKLDFSDETIGVSPTPSTYYAATGFSGHLTLNQGYGYIASGYEPVIYSTIERLDTSNDNVQALSAVISGGGSRSTNGCTQSKDNQYFALGWPPDRSTIDRFDYSTETNTTPGITLQRNKSHNDNNGFEGGSKITRGKPQFNSIQREINQKSYGYIAGGILDLVPPYITKSNVLKLDFSTDLSTELTANYSIAVPTGTNSVKSRDYGYFGGGYNIPGPFTTVCTIDRFDFASETMTTPGAGLTQNAGYSATTQTTSFGYFIAGQTSTPSATCLITRLDYSTESTSQQSLYKVRKRISATENQLFSYITGGGPGAISEISRYDFVNETNAAIPAITTASSEQSTATGNNQFGFIHLGYTPTGDSNTINRIDYSNETINAPGNNLTNQSRNAGGLSSNTFGYFGGGYTAPLIYHSTLDKIDFDTETRVTTNNLVGYKGRITKGVEGKYTSTQTIQNTLKESPKYAYYAAGQGTGSSVERLDNATETISAPPVKRLKTVYGMAAAENSQYGYLLGGYDGSPRTTIQRLDFSSDIFSLSNSNIPVGNSRIASAYTDDYAYVFGSYQRPASSPYKSKTSIDRFEYDNETLKVFGGMASEAREGLVGTQSSYFGYVAGGSMNPPALGVSRVDKLDFTTEISSVLTEGLSHNRRLGATVQNQNFGYFAGGQTTPTAGNRSNVDRVDFSTETITHPGNYDLPQARQAITGSESFDYGYFIGGYTSNAVCTFERLEFETETISLPGGSANSIMSSEVQGLNGGSSLRQVGKNNRNDSRAGLDNQGRQIKDPTYGYFIEGYDGSFVTFVDRIDFSNETYSDTGSRGVNVSASKGINSGGYMYSVLGAGPSPGTNSRRLDYLNETMSSLSSNLSATNATYNPVGNIQSVSRAKAYFGGGYVSSSTSTSQVGRADLTNETASLLGTNTIHEVGDGSAVCNGNYGYWGGGYARGADFVVSTIQRIEFDTEVIVDTGQTLREERGGVQAIQNRTANYGYFAGGNNPVVSSSDFSCHIDRLDLTTESSSQYGNPMPTKKFRQFTVSGSEYGYYIGGVTPGPLDDTSDVYRMEFSTETLETRSPFIRQNATGAATANQTF